ncbi:DUF1493 family protein [Pantoea sp. A4]|uniref:DUF1493 family protein n=1 Tax=Pantoea sp. A4 TaxID=1225184 RepID=UPI000382E475|nr:DUF1493 family protein [Pantoea sp. A4]
MNLDNEILAFIQKELSAKDLTLDSALNIGKQATVPEDVWDLLEKIADVYSIDFTRIEWNKYFPQIGIPFLPNFILPRSLKTDYSTPEPLTIKMIVEAARTGVWGYD